MRAIALAKNVTLCLTVVLLSGCGKKQQDLEATPKPQQTAATVPYSPAAASKDSGESATPAKPSEQQERALRSYNENAWFVHEAMQAAHWDETQTTGIMKLMKAATPDWDHANPSHWQIRGPDISVSLRPWLAKAQNLEPSKQASALLIADRIVKIEEEDDNLEPQDTERSATEGARSGKPPKSMAQVTLEKLGARFAYDEGSERYFYMLNWLQQAYELDPKGRAGELAFVALMSRGFDTSRNCTNGSDQFREVIRRGTAFLGERHNADIEARVHFSMGDAYRDIVALAAGLQGESYADPNNYKSEAPAARTKAIAEYHAGLGLDDKSEAALVAKQHLQSLDAGELPDRARFYCQLLD